MPASSEKQRRFFGAVMAAKKGKGGVGGKARSAAKHMSEGQIKDFLKKKGTAYGAGFLRKCAEEGIDPAQLLKAADLSELQNLDPAAALLAALDLVRKQKSTGIPHEIGEGGAAVELQPRSIPRRALGGIGGALAGGGIGALATTGIKDRNKRIGIGALSALLGGTLGGVLGGKKYPHSTDYDMALDELLDRAKYDPELKKELDAALQENG